MHAWQLTIYFTFMDIGTYFTYEFACFIDAFFRMLLHMRDQNAEAY